MFTHSKQMLTISKKYVREFKICSHISKMFMIKKITNFKIVHNFIKRVEK